MTQASFSLRNIAMAQEFQDPDSEAAGARVPVNLAGVRIPSTPGSGPTGVEQFDLRTPANAQSPEGDADKMEALEKKVKELEAIIQKLVAPPPAAAHAMAAPTPAAKPDDGEFNYMDDELTPMHPKDTKPPPEFGGARKDFMS